MVLKEAWGEPVRMMTVFIMKTVTVRINMSGAVSHINVSVRMFTNTVAKGRVMPEETGSHVMKNT